MEFPVVSTRGSLSHSISRRACSMHIICEVWVCGLPMLGRQPWTGGDEQSAPFRHHTQFRQTLADLCPSFLCFWCWRELTQKIEKSGSDTRLGYVSVPLDDIISPAISLASFFDWPSAQLEQYSGWFAGSVNDWSWQFTVPWLQRIFPDFEWSVNPMGNTAWQHLKISENQAGIPLWAFAWGKRWVSWSLRLQFQA